ncbi:MAG: glycosyltransferase family 39 protein [Bacteroidales bacterium]|nr:glycosyltransferase family 39 protein [Bacteroidales bacterium]
MTIKDNDRTINRILFWLLAISALVRGIAAASIELGNDEVYYWTYALFPDWSHYDHPPMVGWVIQLFSLNLLFDSEFFLRLASVVLMTVETYVIFRIGKEIKNAQAGLYAALLYTASIYAFVITGVFILPDTPLNLFWLLAIWMAVKYFKADQPKNLHLILIGLFTGLATLSKYTGVFVWVGVMIYILLFDRKHLKKPSLYLSILITAVCCLPILIWNLQNDFISFNFHSDRVSLFGKVNFSYVGTELGGELFYNNPVNFVLAFIAVIAAFRGKIDLDKTFSRLLLCIALPLIAIFWFFSLTRPTLPHWNAPAFNTLILLSSCLLCKKNPSTGNRFAVPKTIIAALAVVAFTICFGIVEIRTGVIPLDHHTEEEKLGRDDFTLDMYGWRQLESKFAAFRESKIAEGVMREDDGIVANQWFPLANLDYYVARPLGMKVMGLGVPDNIHKYLWINEERGGFHQGENFWFITESRYMKDPYQLYQDKFETIEPLGTITIDRCGKPAKNFFIYACKNLK